MADQKRFYKGDYSATLYIGDDIDNESAKDFVNSISQVSAQLLETPDAKILSTSIPPEGTYMMLSP